jgi:hypothetical protein
VTRLRGERHRQVKVKKNAHSIHWEGTHLDYLCIRDSPAIANAHYQVIDFSVVLPHFGRRLLDLRIVGNAFERAGFIRRTCSGNVLRAILRRKSPLRRYLRNPKGQNSHATIQALRQDYWEEYRHEVRLEAPLLRELTFELSIV